MSQNKENSKHLLIRLDDLKQEMLEVEILQTKEGYGYNYAPLEVIIPVLTPMLHKHGIGYHHNTGYSSVSNKHYLKTILYNLDDATQQESSETFIDETVKLAKMNEFMVLGSAMTYFRRYHLVVMCGLVTDADTDAGGAIPEKKNATSKTEKAGRSVEANAEKDGATQFIPIFENQIKQGKTKEQMNKLLDTYKSQMQQAEYKSIDELIKKSFNEDK